jgi:hypothetical protein
MQEKTVTTAVIILVLLAGVTIGFAFGDRHGAANPVGLTAPLSMDSTYENSLRGYVALLDNLSARDASDAARQIHAADKALLLIRLADLAEQRGSSAASTRLAADALAVCATAALPYCSSVELRQRAQAMDGVLERMKQVK